MVTTVKGQLATTGKVQFVPYYAVPKMASGIRIENIKEQGAVEVHLSAKQITFKLYDNNDVEISHELVQYTDNSKIDMNRSDYKKLSVGNNENLK